MTYPTKWKRTCMRGCSPGCQRMDLLVESRILSRTEMETRHVAPKGIEPGWIESCQERKAS